MGTRNSGLFGRVPAWLTGTVTLVGLLGAAVLFLLEGDLRWGAMVLALTAGLAGVFALVETWSARSSVSEATPAPLAGERGLPVHPVTGLYMPWIFHTRLAEEIDRAARKGHEVAVAVIEPANILEEPTVEDYARAARALRQTLRTYDLAAQYDEKRFVILLPETETEDAQAAGRRLLSTLRSSGDEPACWRGALVVYPRDGDAPEALLNRAIIGLRRARGKGPPQADQQRRAS